MSSRVSDLVLIIREKGPLFLFPRPCRPLNISMSQQRKSLGLWVWTGRALCVCSSIIMMHKINLRTIYVSICYRGCAAIRFDFLFNFSSSATNLNINGSGISAVGMRSIQTDVRISRNEGKSPTVRSRSFFSLDTPCRLKIITESHLKWKFCAPTSPHVETSQI